MIAFAFVLFSYISWARFIAQKINPLQWISWWLILLYCSILLSVETLGIFHQFTANNLCLIAGFFLMIQSGWHTYHQIKNQGKVEVKSLIHEKTKPFQSTLLIFVATLFISGIAFYNFAFPLAEIDSLAYHLPIVHQFLKTHGVWDVFYAAFVGPNTFFPANHEALQSFISIFTHSIRYNFVITLSSLGLFFLALKDLTSKKTFAHAVILLTLISAASVPFLFKQLLNFQIDLFMFCLFGSGLSWLLSSILNDEIQDLAKAFIIFGFLVGTKYNGLPETIMVLPIFIWAFIHLRKAWKKILFFPLLTMLTGGFWYVRNAILTQNPIYPFSLNLGPIHLSGYQRFGEDLINTSIMDYLSKSGILNVFHTILGNREFNTFIGKTGLIIFPFILGLSLISLGILVYQKTKKHTKTWMGMAVIFALLYTLMGETFYYLNSPYTYTLWNQTIRYSATIYAVIPVVLVAIMYYSEFLWWPTIGSTLFFLLYHLQKSFSTDPQYINLYHEKSGLISNTQYLGIIIVTAIVIATLAWFAKKRDYIDDKQLQRKISIGIGMISAVIISGYMFSGLPIMPTTTAADTIFIAKQHGELNQLIPFITKLREIPHEADEKIGVVGITAYWLLIDAKYEPQYINIDGCLNCTYPDYKNRSIRDNPNETNWLSAIKKSGIKYLLVSSNFSLSGPIYEKTWVEKNPQTFTKILEQDNISLYEIAFK